MAKLPVGRAQFPFGRLANWHGALWLWSREGSVMTTRALAIAFTSSLLLTTALTPVGAADMTNERALNPQREPQNWILHHGNYQGHRFSPLTDIDAETVKNL